MRFLFYACALVSILACPASNPGGQGAGGAKITGGDMNKSDKTVRGEAKITGMKPGRPPLINMEAELSLKNGGDTPVWFRIPSKLPEGSGGVFAIEVFAVEGKGRAVVAQFLGSGGFQALLLPAGADVTIRNLPVSYWGDAPPADVKIAVEAAAGIFIDGKPAKEALDLDLLSDAKVDADFSAAKMLVSRKPGNGNEVPVTVQKK